MWLLFAACALRSGPGPSSPEARALREAEARWANRAIPGELEAAVELWRGVVGVDPTQPVALARLARAEWTLGELEPSDARSHREAGQDYAWRCLLGWPTFAAAVSAEGYRVTARAVEELPAAAAPCLLWAAVGSVSLAAARGPGAALELQDATVLLARLEALAAEGPFVEVEPGFAPWARGRIAVLEAAPEPPPAAARAAFAAAVDAAPGVRLFQRDYADAFPDARGGAFAPPVPDPWARENTAWAPR